jgi:hypothetical protein
VVAEEEVVGEATRRLKAVYASGCSLPNPVALQVGSRVGVRGLTDRLLFRLTFFLRSRLVAELLFVG